MCPTPLQSLLVYVGLVSSQAKLRCCLVKGTVQILKEKNFLASLLSYDAHYLKLSQYMQSADLPQFRWLIYDIRAVYALRRGKTPRYFGWRGFYAFSGLGDPERKRPSAKLR